MLPADNCRILPGYCWCWCRRRFGGGWQEPSPKPGLCDPDNEVVPFSTAALTVFASRRSFGEYKACPPHASYLNGVVGFWTALERNSIRRTDE